MVYLFASIILNTLVYISFKIFEKYKVDALQAIIFNYATCVVTGSFFLGRFPVTIRSLSEPAMPWAILMGGAFIAIFNLIGYCTRKDGITTTTIANKLSIVVPVLFSFFLYHETATIGKIGGIVLAFPAVYLATRVKEEGKRNQDFLWPALLFVASGLLDTLIKYNEQRFVHSQEDASVFTVHSFLFAAAVGIVTLVLLAVAGRTRFRFRNVIAGIFLGIPNYFSIYFYLGFLHSGFLESSAAIPVNNIGIVVASALAAMLLFKEQPKLHRILGLVLSVISILLIAFSGHGSNI